MIVRNLILALCLLILSSRSHSSYQNKSSQPFFFFPEPAREDSHSNNDDLFEGEMAEVITIGEAPRPLVTIICEYSAYSDLNCYEFKQHPIPGFEYYR